MKNKKSQKDIILNELRKSGRVYRNSALDGKYGEIITRLSGIMLKLKQEGINFATYQYQHPNDFEYKLLDKPKSIETFTVKGGNDDGSDRIITRKIW